MDLFTIRASHTRRKWSHVKQATIKNVNTRILCPAREVFSAWSQLQPWSVPRLTGSSSPAILRFGSDMPRRRDGSLNPRQGQVSVWDGKDEMCSMTQTRVKVRSLDPKCVSAQCGRVNVILTFPKTDWRQDGYIEGVQTGSPHDSAAACASFQYQSAGNALRCVFTDSCPSATMWIGTAR